jgi:Asp-tRNA(Asn)/Glu-tRNA(Gln) amidotransferase A subunit family amidase
MPCCDAASHRTAVAVALGIGVIGVGTDTGGSVRIPAAFGGIVGLRPSTGLVPLRGVVPLSHSRDTVGLMAATVGDVTLALQAAAEGSAAKLATCGAASEGGAATKGASAPSPASGAVRVLRVGVAGFMFPSPRKPTGEALHRALDVLRVAPGLELVDLPQEDALRSHFAALARARSTSVYEFSADLEEHLARSEGVRVTLQEIASRTAIECPRTLAAYQCEAIGANLAKKLERRPRREYDSLVRETDALRLAAERVFADLRIDVLAYATFTHLPSKLESRKQDFCSNNRLAPALGWPAVSIPAATVSLGGHTLPQAIEIMARGGQDCELLRAAVRLTAALEPWAETPEAWNAGYV